MKIPPWSYSSLTKFETCPRQYQLTKVLKIVKEPPTEQTIWGERVHLNLEERVRDGKPMDDACAKYEPIAAKLIALGGEQKCEHEIALDANLKPVGWWDPSAWTRAIVDFWTKRGTKAISLDYKTGKVKSDSDQLKHSAAIIMAIEPEITEVSTGFVWLAHNKMTNQVFTRNHVPAIWEDFTMRAIRLEKAYASDKWVPRPSGLCAGWCPVGRANCEFWQPKKGR